MQRRAHAIAHLICRSLYKYKRKEKVNSLCYNLWTKKYQVSLGRISTQTLELKFFNLIGFNFGTFHHKSMKAISISNENFDEKGQT